MIGKLKNTVCKSSLALAYCLPEEGRSLTTKEERDVTEIRVYSGFHMALACKEGKARTYCPAVTSAKECKDEKKDAQPVKTAESTTS